MWELCIKMYEKHFCDHYLKCFQCSHLEKSTSLLRVGCCCYVQDRNVSYVPSAVMVAEWCIYQQQSTSQIISLL